MRRSALAAGAFAAAALFAQAAAAEPVVLEGQCFCKLGSEKAGYKLIVALTDANREAMRKLIEAGGVDLGKSITLKGKGCDPNAWPHKRYKAKCGQTSIFKRSADGKGTWKSVDNSEHTGAMTVRIFANGGIPVGARTPAGLPIVDAKRWPGAASFSVMGRVAK